MNQISALLFTKMTLIICDRVGAHYILSAGHEVLQFPYSPPMLSLKDKQLGGKK